MSLQEHTSAQPRPLVEDPVQLLEVLESITDPFSVLDDELRVVFMNEAAAKLVGGSREQMIGKVPWEAIPEAKDTSFTRAYEQALRERKSVVVEDYFAPWDRWFEASIFPLRCGISIYTRDVTARKRAEVLKERLGVFVTQGPFAETT